MNVAVCGLGSRERGAPTQVTGINRTTTLPLRVSVCVECHVSCLCCVGFRRPRAPDAWVARSSLVGTGDPSGRVLTRYTLFYIFLVFTFRHGIKLK